MSNGRSVQQRILHFLTDNPKEAYTRETIARQVSATTLTAAKELTELRRAELVQETNGRWSTTVRGCELYSTNPNFSPFHVRQAETERRENWAELLGPEVINSQFGRILLQTPPRELLARVEQYLPYFVLAWLVIEKVPVDFNTFDEVLPPTATNDRVVEAFNFLLQELES